MATSAARARPIPPGDRFPDAFAGEPAYLVTGKALNAAERAASEDLLAGTFSKTRQVRLRLYRWPKQEREGLLAVLQYDFEGANPALSCPSIGLLVHLVRRRVWEVGD